MESPEDDDIDRLAAFDEQLRDRVARPADEGLSTKHSHTVRLLHEIFRSDHIEPVAVDGEWPTLPEKVARFRISKRLGTGGFGTVYLAHDPLLNRAVAVKVIHAHLLSDLSMRQRALLEREAMARLQHPNILPVWEAGEDQEQLYIVSEYCPGQTLAEWLAVHPDPMQADQAARWLLCLADAIAHSHQRGVIHRDLKPGNILLDRISPTKDVTGSTQPDISDLQPNQLEPKVSDFGLAKVLNRNPVGLTSVQTQTGLFIGSLEYASPEQIKGNVDAIGAVSDVYALGVLLYQLLTGRLPHAANSQYEMTRRICEEQASFPRDCAQRIPQDLQAITLHAMACQPQDRYASAEELRDDLARFLRRETVVARPVSSLEKLIRYVQRHPAVSGLASACCMLTLLFLLNLVISNRQLARQSQALKIAFDNANKQREVAERQSLLAQEGEKTVKRLRYRESIKLAFDQLQQQNYIGLHDTLSRLDKSQYHTLEAHWLRQQLTAAYFPYQLNNEPVHSLTWNNSDKCLLTISSSGKLRTWHLDNPKAVAEHQTAVGAHTLALHPDGHTLALPEGVGTSHITFWDYVDRKRQEQTYQRHSTTVESLEYSPDGKWLAAGPRYNSVIVTNLETQESHALKSTRRNRQISFSPESDRIAIYSAVGQIEIYRLHDWSLVTTIANGQGAELASYYSHAWVPGRDAIVTCGHDSRLSVYSATDGHKIAEASGALTAESIAVNSDGRTVALGDVEGYLKLFDLQAMLEGSTDNVAITPTMRVLHGKISDLTFVGTDQVVGSDEEGNMMRWCMSPSPTSLVVSITARRLDWQDNSHLWVLAEDGKTNHYLEVSARQVKTSAPKPFHSEREVARAQNSRFTATASADGQVTIFKTATGQPISTCQLAAGKALQSSQSVNDVLIFSNEGDTLFATGNNNHVTAIRVMDGTILWSHKMTDSGLCLAENPQTGTLYVGGGFEKLKLLDCATGVLKEEQVGGNGYHSLILNIDRTRLISGHQDGTLRVRPLESSEAAFIHRVGKDSISAIALTSDDSSVVIGDDDGSVRVVDLEGGSYGAIYRSNLHNPEVADLKWSPDKRHLAALLYSLTTERPQSEVVIFEAGSDDGR